MTSASSECGLQLDVLVSSTLLNFATDYLKIFRYFYYFIMRILQVFKTLNIYTIDLFILIGKAHAMRASVIFQDA